jgi:hypothetical protein
VISLLLALAALALDPAPPEVATSPPPDTAPPPATAPAPAGSTPVPLVSIQHAEDADDVLREAGLRLKSELAVAGYSGQIVTCEIDPVSGPEDCPQPTKGDSISLARAAGSTFIFATWALPEGRTSRRRLHVEDREGGSDATLVAVRAFELLRDVQVQMAAISAHDLETPAAVGLVKEGEPVPPPAGPWRAWAGGSMMWASWTARQANDPIPGVQVGVGRLLPARLMAVGQLAGYLTNLAIADETTAGSPRHDRSLYQAMGTVGLRAGLWSATRGPYVTLRGGVHFIYMELSAPNLTGSSDTVWMPMASFGVGWGIPISRTVILNLEGHVDGSQAVEIADTMEADFPAQAGRWFGGVDLTAAFGLPFSGRR